MDKHVAEIKERLDNAKHEARELGLALAVMQRVCQHVYVYNGHGHNVDYYYCTKCGQVEER